DSNTSQPSLHLTSPPHAHTISAHPVRPHPESTRHPDVPATPQRKPRSQESHHKSTPPPRPPPPPARARPPPSPATSHHHTPPHSEHKPCTSLPSPPGTPLLPPELAEPPQTRSTHTPLPPGMPNQLHHPPQPYPQDNRTHPHT